MTKYYAQFKGGRVIYEVNDDVVTIDEREKSNDPGYHVMPDIAPYRSMLNGKIVNSRSEHRALLKSHKCVEVGNETQYLQPKPLTPPAGLKQTLIDVFNSKV